MFTYPLLIKNITNKFLTCILPAQYGLQPPHQILTLQFCNTVYRYFGAGPYKASGYLKRQCTKLPEKVCGGLDFFFPFPQILLLVPGVPAVARFRLFLMVRLP